MEMATGSQIPVRGNHRACLPRSEFENFCDVHAKGIRYEFKRTHDKMDAGFQEVHDKMDAGFQEVHDKMDAGFARVDDKMDAGFARVDEKFKRVDEKFDKLDLTVSNLIAMHHNSKIQRLHQRIQAVQIFDPSPGLNSTRMRRSPEGFPMMVSTFLDLSGNISLLTRLCQFYDVDWQSWEDPFNPTSPQTMEEAVQTYSGLAHRDLALKLDLDFDYLDSMKIRFEDFQKKRSIEVSSEQYKRSQLSEYEAQVTKRQKAQSLGSQQSSTSRSDKILDRPQAAKRLSPQAPVTKKPDLQPRISMEDLLREPSSPHSSSSKYTYHLGWATGDLEPMTIKDEKKNRAPNP